MYIWVGCKLPEEFSQALRKRCLQENEEIGLSTVAFQIPQHISLKISFSTEEPQVVADYLKAFLGQQKPFSVELTKPARIPGVVWLPVKENAVLQQLHQQLDRQLEARFGIPQHPFDQAFAFHSTLFLDKDTEKLEQMCSRLQALALPQSLWIDTFLLGASPDGKPGTCRITDFISVS